MGSSIEMVDRCNSVQSRRAMKTGLRPLPTSVRQYSTLGGTWGKAVRETIPSSSRSRSRWMSIFLRDLRECPLQIGKPHGWTSQELRHNHQLPTPFQGTKSVLQSSLRSTDDRERPLSGLHFVFLLFFTKTYLLVSI